MEPTDPRKMMGIAKCKAGQRKYDEAERLVLDVLGENPSDVKALTMLLCIYGKAGRTGACEELFESIKRDGMAEEYCYTTIIKAYSRAGRHDDAKRLFDESLALGKSSPFAVNALFGSPPYVRSPGHAMELLGIAKKHGLVNAHVYTSAITVLGRFGRIKDAKLLLKEAMECGHADARMVTVMIRFLGSRRADEARGIFSDAIARDVCDNMLCKAMIHMHIDAGETEKAREVLDISLARSCCDISLCDMMLRAYSVAGRVEDVRAIFDIAIRFGIADSDLSCILIDTYARTGKIDEALEIFGGLKEASQFEQKAYESLAYAYIQSGDLPKARKVFEDAISKGALTRRTCNRIFGAYYKAERFDELEELLDSAPASSMDHTESSLLRAEILRKKKCYVQARDIALALAGDSSIPEEDRHRARAIAAFARKDRGDPEGAFNEFAELFKEVPVGSPHMPRVLCGLVFSWQKLDYSGIIDDDSLRIILSALQDLKPRHTGSISRDIGNAIHAIEVNVR